MKLSVLIPAYNEELRLRECLRSARAAFAAAGREGLSWEVIVCDNNSSDATAAIAAGEGALVVSEPHNQISRARNAAAAAASGDWLLFMDADSRLHPETLEDLLAAAGSGRCAGGGCLIAFEPIPGRWRWLIGLWNLIARAFKLAAGSFLFCRADAFRDVGGFSLELYAAEELRLSQDLKRWGKPRGLGFVILSRRPHVSSGRKLYLYRVREVLPLLLKLAFQPLRLIRDRNSLTTLYDGRR